ncbi:hypothetical protein ES705_28285 [subsurface metagenome]
MPTFRGFTATQYRSLACFISYRDVEFLPSDDGVRIRVWTDVPAHVWIRLTSQEPNIHKKPVLVRGLPLVDDVRFCFTVYEDNEQYEDGDTLVHTFYKEQWQVCKTKWFYFWGSIASEVCVSTSGIFKYHNDGTAPVPVPDKLRTFSSLEPNVIISPISGEGHRLNLTGVISPDATGVLLHIECVNPNTWNRWRIKKPGATGMPTTESVAGASLYCLSGVDENLTIELYQQFNLSVQAWIMGYFNKNVVFLDACADRTPGVKNAWVTIDFSDLAPGAVAGIFQVGDHASPGYEFGIRPHGSTNNWKGWSFGCHSVVKLIDGKIDFYAGHAFANDDVRCTLIGYIKPAGGDFLTNATDISGAGSGWRNIEIASPYNPPSLAIIEGYSVSGAPTHGACKYRSPRAYLYTFVRHPFYLVHPDWQKKMRLGRSNTDWRFKLHGTLD